MQGEAQDGPGVENSDIWREDAKVARMTCCTKGLATAGLALQAWVASW